MGFFEALPAEWLLMESCAAARVDPMNGSSGPEEAVDIAIKHQTRKSGQRDEAVVKCQDLNVRYLSRNSPENASRLCCKKSDQTGTGSAADK